MKSKKTDEASLEFSYSTDYNELEQENKLLRTALEQTRQELEKISTPPLMVCEVSEIVNENQAIIKIANGNKFYVNKLNSCGNIAAGDTVFVEQKNLTIVEKTTKDKNFDVEKFVIIEKPKITFQNIGGLKEQQQEIKEVIELPLLKPELFEKVGITPPKGFLLYGPPGTGKTLLAKAVANSTDSTFIEIVGSELVQKFIGEGSKLVKEMFQLAREKSPTIIFIDEIDALAANRIEMGTSGEREVQRTFMQLLAELDGFKNLDNVKIIGATNRKDILDPALIRPGRMDRLIHVGLPDSESRKRIFEIHTKKMKLVGVDLDKLIEKTKEFSGAEIKSVCTEAGYFAIRENRFKINNDDFEKAIEKVKKIDKKDFLDMFG